MSDTKPSRAARELAGDIADLLPHGFPDRRTFEEAQKMIQSALADLLEKARITVANARIVPDPEMSGATDTYSVPLDDIGDLAAAIEPWKPEK